jgi:hypothetical protein
VGHKWHSAKKQKLNNSHPSEFIGKVLSDAHMKYCQQYKKPFRNNLSYECFTRAKINGVTYKAQPNWHGREWYDWAVVKFPKTKASKQRRVQSGDKIQCIGRIITFFRHLDRGVPTFSFTEQQDFSWDKVNSQDVDPTTYVVLHCQDSSFSHRDLQNRFIYKFQMTALTSMYVLPITSIVGPLAVVPDFIGPKQTSSTNFMAILPVHKQAPFFTQYIHANDSDFDFDMDHVWDESDYGSEEEGEDEGDNVSIECEVHEDDRETDDSDSDKDEYSDEDEDFDDEVDDSDND